MTFAQLREEVAIVSIDILNMGRFDTNDQAIDIALPVLAIECEATPPLENFLDAYEETVLKLVSLGLSTNGISKTLNATESLVEEILMHLEVKEYAKREIGKPWTLTEDGAKYLDGSIRERASAESQYGYMFINAIKKEVLPYFYEEFLTKIKSYTSIKETIEISYEKSNKLTKWKKEIESYKILNEETTLKEIVKIIYDVLINNTEIVYECDKVIINKSEINIINEKLENKNIDTDDDFDNFNVYDRYDEEVDENEKDSYHFECGLKFETSIGGMKNNGQITLVNQIERFRVYDAWYGNN